MTIDPDEATYLLLVNRLDHLAELADALYSPELLWAYWWQVLCCLAALPSLRWMSLDRLQLETTSCVLQDLRRF